MPRHIVQSSITGLLMLIGAALPTRPASAQAEGGLIPQRTLGDSAAPITVYEASDFQCPFCRAFFVETLPHLATEYIATGKVRLIFLNLPIPSLHPNATAAHEFAMCAALQNKFWPVHDLLYRHQPDWAPLQDPGGYFRTLADSAHLNRSALETCFREGTVQRLIQSEAQALYNSGIHSTPSFVIEGALLAGHAPIDAWRPILDSIFAVKTKHK